MLYVVRLSYIDSPRACSGVVSTYFNNPRPIRPIVPLDTYLGSSRTPPALHELNRHTVLLVYRLGIYHVDIRISTVGPTIWVIVDYLELMFAFQ